VCKNLKPIECLLLATCYEHYTNRKLALLSWASAEIFPGGKHRHFAHIFQLLTMMQMDADKTLYPFYAPKMMFMGVGRGDERTKSHLDVEI